MRYVVEKSDLVGQIRSVTLEIVQEMVDEQIRQRNCADVTIFQEKRCANKNEFGFDWIGSEKGNDYWADLMISAISFDSKQKESEKETVIQYENTQSDAIKKSAILLANSIKCLCEVIIDCSANDDKEQNYGLLNRSFESYFDEFNKK